MNEERHITSMDFGAAEARAIADLSDVYLFAQEAGIRFRGLSDVIRVGGGMLGHQIDAELAFNGLFTAPEDHRRARCARLLASVLEIKTDIVGPRPLVVRSGTSRNPFHKQGIAPRRKKKNL